MTPLGLLRDAAHRSRRALLQRRRGVGAPARGASGPSRQGPPASSSWWCSVPSPRSTTTWRRSPPGGRAALPADPVVHGGVDVRSDHHRVVRGAHRAAHRLAEGVAGDASRSVGEPPSYWVRKTLKYVHRSKRVVPSSSGRRSRRSTRTRCGRRPWPGRRGSCCPRSRARSTSPSRSPSGAQVFSAGPKSFFEEARGLHALDVHLVRRSRSRGRTPCRRRPRVR